MVANLQSGALGKAVALSLALILAMQSASPCVALCNASISAASKPLAKPAAALPPCHAEVAAHENPPPASEGSSLMHAAAPECCCTLEASGRAPAEQPASSPARTASGLNTVGAVSTEAAAAFSHRAIGVPRTRGDRSPPGAPLFIAHRSLLI